MLAFIKKIIIKNNKNALAGNRTRAARVAGEHSTTEPPVLLNSYLKLCLYVDAIDQ
jgi:hypothetical protein